MPVCVRHVNSVTTSIDVVDVVMTAVEIVVVEVVVAVVVVVVVRAEVLLVMVVERLCAWQDSVWLWRLW